MGRGAGSSVVVLVLLVPWAPRRPAGAARQPLLASLLRIDFGLLIFCRRGMKSSAQPASPASLSLSLSWLGWPSLPTLPRFLLLLFFFFFWLAPSHAGSSGTRDVPQRRGHRRRAAREPVAVQQLRSPAPGSPASNHLLQPLPSSSNSILPPTLLLVFLLHCILLLLLLETEMERKKQVSLNFQHFTHSECSIPRPWHPLSAGPVNPLTSGGESAREGSVSAGETLPARDSQLLDVPVLQIAHNMAHYKNHHCVNTYFEEKKFL